MGNTRSLFPGAMGPDGFVSCFDHLIPEAALKRMIILKGGPGVGKSTFMRRIHAALCREDAPASLYFCSGDPDSLDAVAIEQAGLLVLDGTAPHVIDPRIPGARDSIINLGECLDEGAMRARLAPIRACMAEHAAASARARACMKAACALNQENAQRLADALDQARLARMTRALIHSALEPSAEPEDAPTVRPVITDAITPKGELSLIAQNPHQRIIRLCSHWAMDVSGVLRAVSAAAIMQGMSVEEHLYPLMPGWLLHLRIPALGLLITTSALPDSEQTFDFSACVPQGALLRCECALEQARSAAGTQIHRAVAALAQAKQLHDELETFYVPNMDFARWQNKLDALLDSLQV